MDVGELRGGGGGEAAEVGRGSAWGSSKENSQPLAVPPLLAARVAWVWKMSVLVGLQVSDCISDGVQVHPLAPIYAPYPKWTHKKRLE